MDHVYACLKVSLSGDGEWRAVQGPMPVDEAAAWIKSQGGYTESASRMGGPTYLYATRRQLAAWKMYPMGEQGDAMLRSDIANVEESQRLAGQLIKTFETKPGWNKP